MMPSIRSIRLDLVKPSDNGVNKNLPVSRRQRTANSQRFQVLQERVNMTRLDDADSVLQTAPRMLTG
jgi:hypothetical protein